MNYGEPILVKGENILIGEINGASLGTSIDAYEILEDELKDKFGQVLFTPHYEYDILASGLTKNQLDSIGISTSLSKHVAEKLKVTYFITMEILNMYDPSILETDTQDQESNVQIQFRIVDLNNLAISSGFILDISTIVYEEGGQDWNFLSSSGLLSKSIHKAAKKILKNAI